MKSLGRTLNLGSIYTHDKHFHVYKDTLSLLLVSTYSPQGYACSGEQECDLCSLWFTLVALMQTNDSINLLTYSVI